MRSLPSFSSPLHAFSPWRAPQRAACTALVVASVLAATTSGCVEEEPARLGVVESPAVYGEDDRREVYEHPDPLLRAIAESAVALVDAGELRVSGDGSVDVLSRSLGTSQDLCLGERYYSQPTAAHCTGMLIDDDLVLTAGHCVRDFGDCKGQLYVFGYAYNAPGVLGPMTSDDIFACKALVARSSNPDFAIVQLDRPASPRRTPAPLRRVARNLVEDEQVAVIGCGSGLPVKIDDGGHVIASGSDGAASFKATTDTFGGHSGSSVLDSTHEVVGVLVEGANDYVWSPRGCVVAAEYPADGGREGETITYAYHALEALCDAGWPSSLCADEPGWCATCETAADCPANWTCQPGASTALVCRAPCASDADCRADHRCQQGRCAPAPGAYCVGDDVWAADACGARAFVETCLEPTLCLEGACGVICDDTCEAGASECTANGLRSCVADTWGCLAWGEPAACPIDQECVVDACVAADGWCRPCARSADCPSQWTCYATAERAATWCSRPCADEGACAPGHACEGGSCMPEKAPACVEGAVWSVDTCGNALAEVRVCETPTTCEDGACRRACENPCVLGTRRCEMGAPEICYEDSFGCMSWQPSEGCDDGLVCADGRCAAPELDAAPDLAGAGCACTTKAPARAHGSMWWGALLALVAVLRRARG